MLSAKKELFTPSAGGYQISRSVRLRSSASAYFNRTFGAGSQTTWTFSAWVKLGTLGTDRTLLSCGSGATDSVIYFQGSTNQILLNLDNVTYRRTTQVFRDPSAWYHIVVVLNTSNATAQNRLRLYINGAEVTDWALNSTVALNATPSFNSAIAHNMARYISGASLYFDGYMTEINFIDGQALTPSSFGETNSQTGVWQPKRYAGTYGTNGFYLNFSDNSGVTATTIGKDYSGNGNNWTPNNISVTAGVTYDSMLDVPTLYADGGNGRGNYATLNPLQSAVAPSDGNLKITGATAHRNSLGTINLPSTSKFYFEGFAPAIQRFAFGLAQRTMNLTVDAGSSSVFSGIYGDSSLTRCWNNGTSLFTLSAIAANDVFQIAVDCATGKVWLGRNNTFYSSAGATTGDPVAGTNATFTLANITDYTSVLGVYDNASNSHINFGQRPFTYTPPTGFVALNTQNLPTPTISKGNQYFDVVTRSGTGATYTKTGLGFQPDFAWTKLRNTAYNHYLQDSVRGVAKQLSSDTTSAEQSIATAYTSFNSDGYTLGNSTAVNDALYTYVDWLWNAGGSTVTNTNGSISAQVRANPTAGFSVVTYTGTGANATVGHGLGVAPSMIIVKERSAAGDSWYVYHVSLGATNNIFLDTTAASSASATAWNNTAPTSTVFSLGTSPGVNQNTQTYVAYCFAAVAGYSAFNKYTGNSSADGPFVYLGFRPRYLLIKSSVVAGGTWVVFDSARSTYNVTGEKLAPNTADSENSGATGIAGGVDFLSNGFKIRLSWGDINTSNTLIYAAFAEVPFKSALGR